MDTYNTTERRFDVVSTLRSVLPYRLFILILACITSMAAFVVSNILYTPIYRTSSTMIITDKRASTNVITNLNTTNQLATVLSTLFNSSELHERVYTEMGYEKLPGRIIAELLPETNFFTFSTEASSPRLSYMLFEKVNEIYPEFSESIIANAVITVVEPPSVPVQPINRNKSFRNAILAFFAALIIYTAVICIHSFLKDTIKNRWEFYSRLSAPLAAEIPFEKGGRSDKKRGISILDPSRSQYFTESFKNLRTTVETERIKNNIKTIVITSSTEKEGKTSIAANLALSLAQIGRHVLLLDCDFGNPSVPAFFGAEIPENAQLSGYLSGAEGSNKIIRRFRELPLYIAANRFPSPDSYELIVSKNMSSLLAQAKLRYDYVLIDTPALTEKTDAYELSELADANLLVVRQDFVSLNTVKNSLRLLSAGSSRQIGCALNFSETPAIGGKRIYGNSASPESDRRVKHATK